MNDVEMRTLGLDTVSHTVEDLTNMMKAVVEAEAAYKKAKEESTRLDTVHKKAKQLLVEALEQSGLQKFSTPEFGTASVVKKFKVRIPDTIEKKALLFKYIGEKYGQEGLDTYTTINYATLNRFYTDEREQHILDGNENEFRIEGLDTPTEETSLSLRKK